MQIFAVLVMIHCSTVAPESRSMLIIKGVECSNFQKASAHYTHRDGLDHWSADTLLYCYRTETHLSNCVHAQHLVRTKSIRVMDIIWSAPRCHLGPSIMRNMLNPIPRLIFENVILTGQVRQMDDHRYNFKGSKMSFMLNRFTEPFEGFGITAPKTFVTYTKMSGIFLRIEQVQCMRERSNFWRQSLSTHQLPSRLRIRTNSRNS